MTKIEIDVLRVLPTASSTESDLDGGKAKNPFTSTTLEHVSFLIEPNSTLNGEESVTEPESDENERPAASAPTTFAKAEVKKSEESVTEPESDDDSAAQSKAGPPKSHNGALHRCCPDGLISLITLRYAQSCLYCGYRYTIYHRI